MHSLYAWSARPAPLRQIRHRRCCAGSIFANARFCQSRQRVRCNDVRNHQWQTADTVQHRHATSGRTGHNSPLAAQASRSNVAIECSAASPRGCAVTERCWYSTSTGGSCRRYVYITYHSVAGLLNLRSWHAPEPRSCSFSSPHRVPKLRR